MSDYKSDNANRQSPQEQPATKTADRLHPLHRWLPAFRTSGPCSLRTFVVQHQRKRRVNPDASRSCVEPENGGIVGRAPCALAGYSGNACRPRVATPGELANRTHRRNRFGHGRSACRYARACRNARKERAGLCRASSVENGPASHRQTSRWGAILHLHLCLSRWGARHSDTTCRFTRVSCRFLLGLIASVPRDRHDTPAGNAAAAPAIVGAASGDNQTRFTRRRWKAWMSSMSVALR